MVGFIDTAALFNHALGIFETQKSFSSEGALQFWNGRLRLRSHIEGFRVVFDRKGFGASAE